MLVKQVLKQRSRLFSHHLFCFVFKSENYTLVCFIMRCSLGGKADELTGTFLFCCYSAVCVSDLVSSLSVHRDPGMIECCNTLIRLWGTDKKYSFETE